MNNEVLFHVFNEHWESFFCELLVHVYVSFSFVTSVIFLMICRNYLCILDKNLLRL